MKLLLASGLEGNFKFWVLNFELKPIQPRDYYDYSGF